MVTERQSGDSKAESRTRQAADQAQAKAGELTDQAKQRARSRTAQQKKRTEENLHHVARALRRTGDSLRNEEQSTLAHYVDDAAGQVERFAGYLGDRSPEDLLHETERFARRDPALFLGGAFALGLLGARFLKSSPHPGSGSRGYDPYAREQAASRQSVGTAHTTPAEEGTTSTEVPGAATPEGTARTSQ